MTSRLRVASRWPSSGSAASCTIPPMEALPVVAWRLFWIGIAVYWAVQIAIARGKPADWQPRSLFGIPVFRITRDRWIAGGVVAIFVCAVLIAISVIVPDFP